jgi:hypothetical protein
MHGSVHVMHSSMDVSVHGMHNIIYMYIYIYFMCEGGHARYIYIYIYIYVFVPSTIRFP